MTQAVTIQKIDEALVARYLGLVVGGSPVSVFIEEPDPDRRRERTFPSLSLKLISLLPAFELRDSETDQEEEIALDVTDETHPMRTMRQGPEPYSLVYSLDSWNRPFAKEARDLLMLAMLSRTPVNGYLSVENVDGEQVLLDCFARDAVISNDELEPDEVIYHKTRELEVVAWLDLVGIPHTSHRAVAVSEIDVYDFVNETMETLDLRIEVSDDSEERL
jgi:hypothetical protein